MNLPNVLEELNQGAEKSFGENAKNMIDHLLYAKLPPKLERLVNMAWLENGSYEEIVAHHGTGLELNALEESDDSPMATMASASDKTRNLLFNGIDTSKVTQCSYCNTEDLFWKNSRKLKKKRVKDGKNGKKPHLPTYLD